MLKILVVLILFSASGTSFANEFSRPWDNPNAALILDPFYANKIDWDKLKSEKRVIAIIHKSTIGLSEIDPSYFSRKKIAKDRGYLWGSYHWGTNEDPEKQADHYLETIKPEEDELISLDLEDISSKKLMSAENALIFIKRIKSKIGRYPIVYTNQNSIKIISKNFKNTDFRLTPLWYARFIPKVTDFPRNVWPSYTLWQFSSEINHQISIPGTMPDMDVSVYNGSVENLRKSWPAIELPK